MTIKTCDLCGERIFPQTERKLTGALADLTGAEEICARCAIAAKVIPWREVVRESIKREAVR